MLRKLRSTLYRSVPATVRARIRTWRIRHLIGTVVEHSYGGKPLKVYIADQLSQGWYDSDWPELPEIATLRHSRLKPGAKVFDAGAHQGVVALMIAREVGETGLVVAIDPSAHNIAAADRNRQLNGAEHVRLVQAAVSDRLGQLFFADPGNGNGMLDDGARSPSRFSVEAITLDELANRYGIPDVVFIDVEGAEARALAGAGQVIASGADFFIEVHADCGLEKLGGSVNQVLSFFPRDVFSLLVRSEKGAEFVPLKASQDVPSGRFFLIATSRARYAR